MIDVRNGSAGVTANQSVSQLASLLQNPATVLPVFTRFHQAHQQLTIPVVAVVINGDILEVKTIDGTQHSIIIELLQDVVVFRDGAGKPVFLTEFQTGGDLVVEYLEEMEEENRKEALSRLKYQDVYLPINNDLPVFKPNIQKQKKTEKVYRYGFTMRNDKRKAA